MISSRFRIRPLMVASCFRARTESNLVFRRLLVLLSISLSAAHALGQEVPAGIVNGDVTFRRIYVQSDSLERHSNGLLPVDREELARLLADATEGNQPDAGGGKPRVLSAKYDAKLDENGQLIGTAELKVESVESDQQILILPDLKIAASDFRWQASSGQNSESILTVGNAPDGTLAVLLQGSGTIRFKWLAQPQPSADGRTLYQLNLVKCPQQFLTISTAPDQLVSCTKGYLRSELIEDAKQGQSLRSWNIELGGHRQINLLIGSPSSQQHLKWQRPFRQETTYELAPQALNYSTTLSFQPWAAGDNDLSLLVDSTMELVSARIGDEELLIRESHSNISDDRNTQSKENKSGSEKHSARPKRIVVSLPRDLAVDELRIRLQGIAKIPTSLERLPCIQVENATWLEGRFRLRVPHAYELVDLESIKCHQIANENVSEGIRNDLAFQASSEQARLRVLVKRSVPIATAAIGSTIGLARDGVTNLSVIDISAQRGAMFSLSAKQNGWIIDSITSEPADAIEDWQADNLRRQTARFSLRLRQGVTVQQPVRLKIQAHRPVVGSEVIAAGSTLSLGNFAEAKVTNSLFAIASESSEQIALLGDEGIRRLESSQIQDEQKQRVSMANNPILLDGLSELSGLAITLRKSPPQFTAQLKSKVVISDHRDAGFAFQNDTVIEIDPTTTRVTKFSVRFSEAITDDAQWVLDGADSTDIVVDKQEDGDRQMWTVGLTRPASEQFRIRIRQFGLGRDGIKIPLADVVEAVKQDARVDVLVPNDLPLQVVNSGLTSATPLHHMQQTRSRAFRYERWGNQELVIKTAASSQSLPLASCQFYHLHSQNNGAGLASNHLELRLANQGLRTLTVQLPSSALNARVYVNGQATNSELQEASNEMQIALPRDFASPKIEIEYTSTCKSLGVWGSVEVTPVSLDIPVLEANAAMSLPAGVESILNQDLSLQQRLFGPLARHSVRSDRFGFSANRHAAQLSLNKQLEALTSKSSETKNPPHLHFAYVRPDTVRLFWWACLLLAMGTVWRARIRTWKLLTPACGLLATMALFASVPYAFIGNALLLGVLLGSVILAFQGRSIRFGNIESSNDSLGWSIAGILLVTIVLANQLALGQVTDPTRSSNPAVDVDAEPTAPGEIDGGNAKRILYRVVTPVDQESNPAGKYDYVSPDMYDILRNLAISKDVTAKGWLIRNARYQLAMSETVPGSWDSLVAEFQIEALRFGIRLPTFFDDQSVAIEDIKLDGQMIPLTDSGQMPQKLIAEEAGRYRLSVRLTPRDREASRRVRLAIPPVSDSTIVVNSNGTDQTVKFQTASGQISFQGNRDELEWRLGPVAELHQDFQSAGDESVSPRSNVASETLAWLRIQPDQVRLDLSLKLTALSGSLRQVQIEFDSDLVPLPPDPELPIASWSVDEAKRDRLDIEFDDSVGNSLSLNWSFLHKHRNSGLGKVIVPKIDVLSSSSSRYWLGISASQDHDLQLIGTPSGDVVAIDQFVEKWPGDAKPPQLAFSQDADDAPITIRCTASSPTVTAKQQTSVLVDLDKLEIRYVADVNVVGEPLGLHRIAVPSGVRIHQVTLLADGESQLARWSPNAQGELVLWLKQPLAGEHRIELRGESAASSNRNTGIPVLKLQDANAINHEIRVYRAHGIHMTVKPARPFKALDIAALQQETMPLTNRLHSALALIDGQNQSTKHAGFVRVRLNQVSAETQAETTVFRQDDDWFATYKLHVNVTKGSLDRIRLTSPMVWGGDLAISPKMEFREVLVPSNSQREIILLPESPVDGRVTFSLTSKLEASGIESVTVPDIRLVDMKAQSRFLELPTELNGRSVLWETAGLTPVAELSPQLKSNFASSSNNAYRISGEQFNAILRSVEADAPKPVLVRLLDVALSCQASEVFLGECTFYLESENASTVRLAVPPLQRLVSVTVDQQRAIVTPISDGVWEVDLGSVGLPQQLGVRFHGPKFFDSERAALSDQIPTLVGVQAESSTWTLHSERLLSKSSQDASKQAVTILKAKVAVSFMNRFLSRATDKTDEEVAAWIELWRPQIASLEQTIKSVDSEQRDTSADDVLNKIEAMRQSIEERFGASGSLAQETSQQFASSNLTENTSSARNPLPFTTYRIGSLDEETMTAELAAMQYPGATEEDSLLLMRLLLLLLISAIAFGITATKWCHALLMRWPYAAMFGLGLIWVSVMHPSWLGWVFIFTAIIGGLSVPIHFLPRDTEDTNLKPSKSETLPQIAAAPE